MGKILFHQSVVALFALGGILTVTSWINFVFDRELDAFAGEDVSFFKHIPPREMMLCSLLLSTVSLILLLYLNYLIFLSGLLILVVGILYSVPPIRLKTHPPLDCVANALEFGILPVFMGFMLLREYVISTQLLVLAAVAGLIVTTYYLFIGVLDIETDRKYGIKTSCTLLGSNQTINTGLTMFFLSLLASATSFGLLSPVTVSLLLCSPLVVTIKIKTGYATLAKTLSLISLVWTESILLILFILSHSILPIAMFILVLMAALYFVHVYFTIKKVERI
ncbi:MAG TPA: hypothetical protein EYP23_06090 [Thermoplasmata archaeon]|nr:hypothetical protein [Thermoplasmata archaeon]